MTVSHTSGGFSRLSRGRALTGITLVGVGVLWLLEAAGVGRVDWFYVLPGILGLIGIAMIAGVGGHSAGGLMPLGFVLIAIMFLGTLVPRSLQPGASVGNRSFLPATGSELKNDYRHGMGNLEVDLRRLDLVGSRSVTASVGMGELVVRVPEGMKVDIRATAGMGDLSVFGSERSGVAPALNYRSPGRADGDVLELQLSVGMGTVEVRR
jgi:hypothetical protein